MIFPFEPKNYVKVSSLFEPLRFQLFPRAVLAGLQEGQVYVDDPQQPHSAFLLSRGAWGYLAGDPGNDGFNQALNRAIFDGTLLPEDAWGMFISCEPAWQGALDAILHPRVPVAIPRRHYLGRKLDYAWRENVPKGYRLKPIDRALRDLPGISLPPDVEGLLDSWDRVEDPKQRGFGTVAFYGEELAAYAVIDVVVSTVGDIGLVTEPAHRRKGLATVTSAATVEYGLEQRGLTEVLWDCGADNAGSVHTAEKLGFDFDCEHTMFLFDLDPAWNYTTLGLNALDRGDYTKAQAWSQRGMDEGGEVPPLCYFVRACAHAGLGEAEAAFLWLETAIEKGWTAIQFSQERPEFQPWHDRGEWQSALKRMK